jgi:hypothetical protein
MKIICNDYTPLEHDVKRGKKNGKEPTWLVQFNPDA